MAMKAGMADTAGFVWGEEFPVYRRTENPAFGQSWAITQDLLRKMKQETQQRGVGFVVFYVPARIELSAEEWSKSNIPASYGPDVVVQRVAQICNAEGIALLEPSQRFREARKNGPLSYAHDIHWTKAGHRLAADLVAEYVHNTVGGRIEPQVRAQNSPVGR